MKKKNRCSARDKLNGIERIYIYTYIEYVYVCYIYYTVYVYKYLYLCLSFGEHLPSI